MESFLRVPDGRDSAKLAWFGKLGMAGVGIAGLVQQGITLAQEAIANEPFTETATYMGRIAGVGAIVVAALHGLQKHFER